MKGKSFKRVLAVMAAVLIVSGAVPVQPIAELSRGFAITANAQNFYGGNSIFTVNSVFEEMCSIGREATVVVGRLNGVDYNNVAVTFNGGLTLEKKHRQDEQSTPPSLYLYNNAYVIVNGDLYVSRDSLISCYGNSKIIVSGNIIVTTETDEYANDVTFDGIVHTDLQNLVYHPAEGIIPAYFSSGDKNYSFDGSNFTEINEIGAIHSIAVDSGITNGTVAAKVGNDTITSAPEGTLVTLTATPADGYYLKSFTVRGAGGNNVPVTNNKFTMPAGNVTVGAEFVQYGTFADLQNLIRAENNSTITLEKNYKAGANEGALEISGGTNITIDLNGHTIDRGLTQKTYDGYVIRIFTGGNLTLTDGSDDPDTAVYDGTGKITGGYNNYGGGVYVDTYGTFTMSGGTISGNTSSWGGGGVYNNGTFNMSGGAITANTVSSGGIVENGGTFTMTGGTIKDNTGSGVVNFDSTFIMTGGTISENKDNYNSVINVFVGSGATMYLGSGTEIYVMNQEGTVKTIYTVTGGNTTNGTVTASSDNTITAGGKAYFAEGDTVTLTATPDEGYTLKNFTVNGEAIEGSTFEMPAGNVTVSAKFEKKLNTVTIPGAVVIEATPLTGGKNMYFGGIDDEGKPYVVDDINDAALVYVGNKIFPSEVGKQLSIYTIAGTDDIPYLTGEYAANDKFNGVYVDGTYYPNVTTANLLNAISYCGVDVHAEWTFSALARKAQEEKTCYNITITAENGTVAAKVGNDTVTSAPEGTLFTLTATPADGYTLKNFTVNGKAIEGSTFEMPAGNVTVSAEFEKISNTVTIPGAVVIEARNSSGGKIMYFGGIDGSGKPYVVDDINKAALVYVGNNITSNTVNWGTRIDLAQIIGTTDILSLEGEIAANDALDGVSVDGTDFPGVTRESILSAIQSQSGVIFGWSFSAVASQAQEEVLSYNITTAAENGTVTAKIGNATVTSAPEGETVTLTATPAQGYVLKSLTVKDASGNNVTVTDDQFTMPAGNVTVSAVFEEVGTFDELQSLINSAENNSTITLKKSYKAASGESAIEIPEGKTITINLNGHTIDRGLTQKTDNGSVIFVSGNLTLTDTSEGKTGTITGGWVVGDGGGVYVNESGTFNMYGGNITGNNVSDGSGGGVRNSGTFNMSGGTISGNNADGCGGVVNDGTFIMTGGTISGNTDDNVYLRSGTMYLVSGIKIENLSYHKGTVKTIGTVTAGETANGTVTAGSDNTFTVGETTYFIEGATVTLTATPADGYTLKFFTVNGVVIEGSTFTMPESNVTVGAKFEKIRNTVTIPGAVVIEASNSSGGKKYFGGIDGNGAIIIVDNISDAALVYVGNRIFPSTVGAQLSINTIAGTDDIPFMTGEYVANDELNGVSVDGTFYPNVTTANLLNAISSQSVEPLYWNLTAVTRKAIKKATCYNITASAENGTVTAKIGNNAVTSAPVGETVTLTATPDDGYQLSSLTVMNGATPVAVENGQFTMPAGNVTVSAEFEKKTYADGIGEHLYGYSLSFDGDIGVNFYMELADDIAESKTAYILFGVPTPDGPWNYMLIFVKDAVSAQVDGKNYHVFKRGVAAKDMNTEQWAQIFDGGKSSTEYTFSVKEYAKEILDHPDRYFADEAQRRKGVALVKAMLNYGSYAQVYFDPEITDVYDKKTAASGLGTDIENVNGVTAQEINIPEPSVSLPDGITFEGASLSLRSETTLSLYFKNPGNKQFDVTADVSNPEGLYINTDTSGEYTIVSIRCIKAKDLNKELGITINSEGQSDTYYVQYIPLYYCKKVLESDKTSDELKNLCKALFLYWKAAHEYFGD